MTNGFHVPYSGSREHVLLSLHGNQTGGNHRFSAQDVLGTAIHESFGLFVQMEKNFLSHNPDNLGNEAIRYHQAVGLAQPGNVLPKIVTELKTISKFGALVEAAEKLMKLFEIFHSEPTSSGPEYEQRTKEILKLIQRILSYGRAALPINQRSF